jgi:hypothetical protein
MFTTVLFHHLSCLISQMRTGEEALQKNHQVCDVKEGDGKDILLVH